MRSSISNSKSEAKVIGFVILLMLGAEGTLRTIETKLSVDLKHIRKIPKIAAEFTPDARPSLLFLGNSLTRVGLDSDALRAGLKKHGIAPKRIRKVIPDNTDIVEWYYLFKRYFVETGHLPTYLLVGGAGWHFDDKTDPKPRRLASYYTGWRDIPEVFAREFTTFPQRVEYMLSFFSKTYTLRERVSRRALDMLIPGYRAAANRINETLKVQTATEQKNVQEHQTYERLTRLIELTRTHDVKLVIYLIPMPSTYDIAPKMKRILDAGGVKLIDCRQVAGITKDNFPDKYHLDQTGTRLFTQELTRKLVPILQKSE